MARKGKAPKREIIPDPRFGDLVVTKLMGKLMQDGKKSAAERVVYGAFDIIKEKTKDDPLTIFKKALDNVKPLLEVRSRRVGGATYQIPMEVRQERSVALALRWLINFSRSRSEKGMGEKLAAELMDAANKRGASVKKREDIHKMADANKAFAHYRW